MSAVRIGVAGAAGRMGQQIIQTIAGHPAATLAAAVESAGHPQLGTTVAPHINIAEQFAAATVDVFIDFSVPAATLQLAEQCRRHKIALVVGTTGFDHTQKEQLHAATADIPLFVAPNMSVGINVMFALAAQAAKLLQAGNLGGGYDLEVWEAHHRHKKDAPSGTALRLGETLAEATGVTLDEVAVFDRHGRDCERKTQDIGFSVVRGGDTVGEHRAIFSGTGEQLEIVHRAASRQNFASGAVRAALFAAHAKPGLYGMEAIMAGT